jgi:hypothetical protein
MSRPKPIIHGKERTILLEVYENPDKSYDTFAFTDMFTSGLSRSTPEYGVAFKETVKVIESLVEQGQIDGKQLKSQHLGMYYTELKVKFKGKQTAIREKRNAEELVKQMAELEKQMPEFVKRSSEVDEEIIRAGVKEKGQ